MRSSLAAGPGTALVTRRCSPISSYEGALKSVRMRLVEQRLAPLAPALVLAQGFVEFDFELADGRHSATRMRTTLILIEQGGQWRIRQHHFSMEPDKPPIDGD
ncbi:MAG: nuclear transport factor 2 family protein [Burkholderiaceae bacterium]